MVLTSEHQRELTGGAVARQVLHSSGDHLTVGRGEGRGQDRGRGCEDELGWCEHWWLCAFVVADGDITGRERHGNCLP